VWHVITNNLFPRNKAKFKDVNKNQITVAVRKCRPARTCSPPIGPNPPPNSDIQNNFPCHPTPTSSSITTITYSNPLTTHNHVRRYVSRAPIPNTSSLSQNRSNLTCRQHHPNPPKRSSHSPRRRRFAISSGRLRVLLCCTFVRYADRDWCVEVYGTNVSCSTAFG
jgi:hypothetical protein